MIVNKFQPPGRLHLYATLTRAWKQGLIVCSGEYHPETFISEVDQLAAKHKVNIEIKRLNGKAYVMANEGLPLEIGANHPQRDAHKERNPHYRVNQSVWSRISEGLGL